MRWSPPLTHAKSEEVSEYYIDKNREDFRKGTVLATLDQYAEMHFWLKINSHFDTCIRTLNCACALRKTQLFQFDEKTTSESEKKEIKLVWPNNIYSLESTALLLDMSYVSYMNLIHERGRITDWDSGPVAFVRSCQSSGFPSVLDHYYSVPYSSYYDQYGHDSSNHYYYLCGSINGHNGLRLTRMEFGSCEGARLPRSKRQEANQGQVATP